MTQSGWRKPTPGVGQAEQLAQAGERASIPKSRAILAVKRIGARIGLKAADMMLLNTLAAFSQASDWQAGQRPVVWPSNVCLMTRTGFSLSSLKRHLRRRADAGVIAFRDSPNGKPAGPDALQALLTNFLVLLDALGTQRRGAVEPPPRLVPDMPP